MSTLALRYRPRTFADVTGQPHAVGPLYRMSYLGTLPSAVLLHGGRGSGKTSTARIIASAANCEEPPGPAAAWPCGSCPSCKAIADSASPDVLEIDAASNGRVDEIREIKDLVLYQAAGRKHMVLLDEAQSMSRDAFNALLKVLEEPPPDTIFVLLTTEPARILPTVYSRCMPFGFRRLSAAHVTARLAAICQAEGLAMEPGVLQAIAERCDGAMRDAVNLLDQAARAGVNTLERYSQMMGMPDAGGRLIAAMLTRNHSALFAELDAVLEENGDFAAVTSSVVRCLRDMLVLQGGGQINAQGSALSLRDSLARAVASVSVVAAMRVLWDLRTRAPRTEPRSSLELAMVLCMERLAPASQGSGLSLEQMQAQ